MSALLLMAWMGGVYAAEQEGLFATELGAGGVSRAATQGLTSILTAPSVLALQPRYDFAVGARLGPDNERILQGAAMDSTTGPMALGLLYSRSTATPPTTVDQLPGFTQVGEGLSNPRTRTLVAGGLATALGEDIVGVGVNVSYFHEETRFGGVVGAVNAGASLSGSFAEKAVLTVSGENLLPDSLDWSQRRVSGAARYQPAPAFGLEVDLIGELDAPGDSPVLSYAVGADGTIAERVPLRAGFSWDGLTRENRLTGGVGIGKETFFLEYGVAAPLQSGDASALWHALCLRISFS